MSARPCILGGMRIPTYVASAGDSMTETLTNPCTSCGEQISHNKQTMCMWCKIKVKEAMFSEVHKE